MVAFATLNFQAMRNMIGAIKPKLCFIYLAFLLVSCTQGGIKIADQTSWNKTTDISDSLHVMPIPDSLSFPAYNKLFSMRNNVIIRNAKSVEDIIFFFDAKTLKYEGSALHFGEGPDEIVSLGNIAYNGSGNELVALDHGRQKVLMYNLDELLSGNNTPERSFELHKEGYPREFCMLDSCTSLGTMVVPKGASKYSQVLAHYDFRTGRHVDFPSHEEISNQRITLDVSLERGMCAVANTKYDYFILTDLDGKAKVEIHGPLWGKEKRLKPRTYGEIAITKSHIVVSYSGKTWGKDDNPDQLEIFSLDGEYERTLSVGHPINNFCYNEEAGRLFFSLDDDPQFVYYDFEE